MAFPCCPGRNEHSFGRRSFILCARLLTNRWRHVLGNFIVFGLSVPFWTFFEFSLLSNGGWKPQPPWKGQSPYVIPALEEIRLPNISLVWPPSPDVVAGKVTFEPSLEHNPPSGVEQEGIRSIRYHQDEWEIAQNSAQVELVLVVLGLKIELLIVVQRGNESKFCCCSSKPYGWLKLRSSCDILA